MERNTLLTSESDSTRSQLATKVTHGLGRAANREARYRLITDVLDGRWPDIGQEPRTIQAEAGLGIVGSPVYYFVMRTERAFGRVVFIYANDGTVDGSAGGGATPFDSGGLWHGHIHTDPAVNEGERRSFFHQANVQLRDWQQTFDLYLRANYATPEQYIRGLRPLDGTPQIVPGPPNKTRAWTWELRVPRGLAAKYMRLVGGAMLRSDYDDYLDWLWDESSVEDREATRIQTWVTANMILSEDRRSASREAEAALLDGT